MIDNELERRKMAARAADEADGLVDGMVDPQEISRAAHENLVPEEAAEIDAALPNEVSTVKRFTRALRNSRLLSYILSGLDSTFDLELNQQIKFVFVELRDRLGIVDPIYSDIIEKIQNEGDKLNNILEKNIEESQTKDAKKANSDFWTLVTKLVKKAKELDRRFPEEFKEELEKIRNSL